MSGFEIKVQVADVLPKYVEIWGFHLVHCLDPVSEITSTYRISSEKPRAQSPAPRRSSPHDEMPAVGTDVGSLATPEL